LTLIKYQIARDGVFNTPQHHGITAVEQANVHEVLMYAMLEKMRIEEQIG